MNAPAVVVFVRDGVADYLASPGIDVVVIDFDNLIAGDAVPPLSAAHLGLIQKHPQLHEGLKGFGPVYAVCDNCQANLRRDQLHTIENLHSRVAPGEIMPAGQCPWCGAVAHLADLPTDAKPKVTPMTETEVALLDEAAELRRELAEKDALIATLQQGGNNHASA